MLEGYWHRATAYPQTKQNESELYVAFQEARGRIFVADSLSYITRQKEFLSNSVSSIGHNDVVVSGSFAGVPPFSNALGIGVKSVIAHEAGVGKDQAGIAGLKVAQEFGIPAAAVETMSARIASGQSVYAGKISHTNEAARSLGVRPGQLAAEAARLLLGAKPGRRADVTDRVLTRPQQLVHATNGGIFAVSSINLIEGKRSNDVFCTASHSGQVMAEYSLAVRPKGVFANDAGISMDESGIDGLPILDKAGIAAVAVAAMSARIGDPLSTYNDGVCSTVNEVAKARGVRVGMPVKEAARVLLA